ncbi:hypothetical protein ATE92_0700 [Ulvibacter sp. MAR_2010_11]|uniref:hypothetical protein n=1 Tax=Ulvibacter sp. MAR_2010_11 TaxID=1250229 RepID=UPI000C2CB0A9|nr:hypothetical protein [Ulvibacter sp. MAR_2010_11]PKA82569.1 hypothetical protein ATE92_0700 [Ulvibacter sp. MAR_2010_11]
MFSKANIISTLVLTIWAFGGGYLLWGILGESLFADHMLTEGLMKEMPDMAYIFVGCLIQAFGFSTIYGKYGATAYGAASGFALGFWFSVIVGLGEGLIDFATANILDLQGILINFVLFVIFFGIMGLLAGLIYKKTTA